MANDDAQGLQMLKMMDHAAVRLADLAGAALLDGPKTAEEAVASPTHHTGGIHTQRTQLDEGQEEAEHFQASLDIPHIHQAGEEVVVDHNHNTRMGRGIGHAHEYPNEVVAGLVTDKDGGDVDLDGVARSNLDGVDGRKDGGRVGEVVQHAGVGKERLVVLHWSVPQTVEDQPKRKNRHKGAVVGNRALQQVPG